MQRRKAKLTQQQVSTFVSAHLLPEQFFRIIEEHYSLLAEWLVERRQSSGSHFIGINGAQGTGKSTLAAYLKLHLERSRDWHVAVLSIDDFYLTKLERERLAQGIHPLLTTRGVPGTHDIQMLTDYVNRLRNLEAGTTIPLPRFDKAKDDRAGAACWPTVSGPIDMIILEGWCVGSRPQSEGSLAQPINCLEELEDKSTDWRRFVNNQLCGPYADLFSQLDAMVFLEAPNFDAVYRWRVEQEEKLAANASGSTTGIMSHKQLSRFVQHFERITRANLKDLPAISDVVLELNDDHDCVQSHF